PELPPQNPLFKIEGTIEELEIQYIKTYFDDRAYSTDNYETNRKIEIGGSGLLMLLGDFIGSAFINKSERREMDCSDFVQGKINGKRFYGWLGKTVIKENDYVEMAVMEKDDCYVVYAITLPEKRMIMMTPRCYHGRYYLVLTSALGSFSLGVIAFFVIALFGIGHSAYFKTLLYSGIYLPIVTFAFFLIMASVDLIKPNSAAKLSERIFFALGIKKYRSVNLES
ncbi:putative type VI secretion system effector, partial [Xenorhabdus szentirmaii]